jgi:hypothetical protein
MTTRRERQALITALKAHDGSLDATSILMYVREPQLSRPAAAVALSRCRKQLEESGESDIVKSGHVRVIRAMQELEALLRCCRKEGLNPNRYLRLQEASQEYFLGRSGAASDVSALKRTPGQS